jgi:hypothetical protein
MLSVTFKRHWRPEVRPRVNIGLSIKRDPVYAGLLYLRGWVNLESGGPSLKEILCTRGHGSEALRNGALTRIVIT